MGEPIRYVALLRGINVGGHRMIKKEELTEIFTTAGLADVQTLLASGNVVFSSPEDDEAKLQSIVETALEKHLGYRVDVMVRTIWYMKELLMLEPFAEYLQPAAKFYVTFLSHAVDELPEFPIKLKDQNAYAVGVNDREFFAVSFKRMDGKYGDFTPFMIKTFGKQPATTRNWNTIVKLAAFEA